ncbi:ribosome biogenesis GTP-binding protein YihA/YsxC ['Elaeagnus angustifolia' witches'-broom phytoplasma]|uniref:Probable GTP-binding protein EngB n=1 Tax='Elaeagnus angustifolia' witches'-broom phytoplasma TaxID=1538355 RepID=A0ABS5V8V7_9MOLU|nr:ribosome biogenesis GTP-binding protein YihA/YsxC ['Elaeagnus angustifolia' witches'-broom phytoplasma]MCX2955631.1 ribosome biogenesis GTP-binding protein YihA/YsxC [Candidatus Phytoplasma australiense]
MIKKATFVRSIVHFKDIPLKKQPEIVLMGRSNVGKSTFINALTQRKKLAKISQMPGKTITLNYYDINESFYLIDTPGYGYAKKSKEIQKQLLPMIISFLEQTSHLKAVFQLIDFKVGATQEDDRIHQALLQAGFEVVLLFVKKDKVKKNLVPKQLKMLVNRFPQIKYFFLISSKQQEGLEELKLFLSQLMDPNAND